MWGHEVECALWPCIFSRRSCPCCPSNLSCPVLFIHTDDMFASSSKARLTHHDLGRFPDNSQFHHIARVVCGAGCLPRKELLEAWEVARRIRRRFRGGRIVDLCAGHGLLGQIMMLLDDSSPEVVIVDRRLPKSAATLARALAAEWPRLETRVTFQESEIGDVRLQEEDVVVSVHACGSLTDQVIEQAVAAHARLAVLPCCHDLDAADTGALRGWLDGPLAVDVVRATRLRALGWQVWTQTIPAEITPHNRLLLADC
jgi:methyltransferase family protein